MSLFNLRTSLLFVLSFMGFFRFSEEIKLEISDLKKRIDLFSLEKEKHLSKHLTLPIKTI